MAELAPLYLDLDPVQETASPAVREHEHEPRNYRTEAQEIVVLSLTVGSAAILLVGTLLAALLLIGSGRPLGQLLIVSGALLVPAALPWLGLRPLVRLMTRRRRDRDPNIEEHINGGCSCC